MHKIVVVILIIGLVVAVSLVSQETSFFSKASPDISPKNVTVSNISDSGFTISWVTDKETIGFIKYSDDSSLNQTEVDVRDTSVPKLRTTHFVSLKNLSPKQNYFFKIVSADSLFGQGDKPYQQITAPVSEDTPPVPVLTFGKLKKKDGSVPKEAIVYLKLSNSTILSTSTGDDGNYLITVTNARNTDLSFYINAKDGDSAQIWVEAGESGNLQNTQIKISNTKALPDLILGEAVKSAQEDNTLQDFNGDGLINAHDYAIRIKKILKL